MTETMREIATLALVLLGAGFSLLAAVGLIRMPDLYMRMQSATKAGTLGLACTALAAGVHFGNAATAMEAILVIMFAFATAPIASHLISRAAWVIGVPLWRQTVRDDLSERGHLGRVDTRTSADGTRVVDLDGEVVDTPPAASPAEH
ncbi:MAG: monovalent cation/H(+) antiporter subunit G [Planctomycetota bacterium]